MGTSGLKSSATCARPYVQRGPPAWPRNNFRTDPGFGFGKTPAQNLMLVRDLAKIAALGHPVLLERAVSPRSASCSMSPIRSAADPATT
jgi:hypothetical protein